MVTLTVLPVLATAAVAAAEPPERHHAFSPPGMTQPNPQQEPEELSPPGLTPDIHQLTCDEDPNWRLRNDCLYRASYGGGSGGGVIRGGFGGYFSGGSSGGSRASRPSSGG
jgi:hypothetical protein